MPPKSSALPTLDELLSNCVPEPNTGCWIWLGARFEKRGGYGALQRKGHGGTLKAHRLAFKLATGIDAENVLHTCDNPPCIWPGHLYAGSDGDNLRDAYSRKRRRPVQLFGENHPRSRMTWDAVRDLRARRLLGESAQSLSDRFDISLATVRQILRGITWQENQ